jgi:hypothetical protein
MAGLMGMGAVVLGGLSGCEASGSNGGSSFGSEAGGGSGLPAISEPPKKYWAWVAKEMGGRICWGCINERGEYVVEPKIIEGEHVGVPDGYLGEKTSADYIDNFQSNGLAGISKPDPNRGEFSSCEGCFNTSGDPVIPQQYSYIEDFKSNGLALVQELESPDPLMRRGYIDASGNKRIESLYAMADGFKENGTAKVGVIKSEQSASRSSDLLYGFIDENGQWLIESQFEHAESFFEQKYSQIAGKWWALVKEGDWFGYIDETGSKVVSFEDRVTGISPVYHRLISGDSYSSLSYWYPDEESGLLVVTCGDNEYYGARAGAFGMWGYAGPDGKLALDPIYDAALPFFEGYAVVSMDGWKKMGIIDTSGKYIVEPQLNYIDRYHDGLALARKEENGTFGFLDTSGAWAIEPLYNKLDLFDSDGFAVASGLPSSSNRGAMAVGLLDRNGDFSFPPYHNFIKEPNRKGYRFADSSNGYSLIDSGGNQVANGEYGQVGNWSENGLCAVGQYRDDGSGLTWGFVNESGDLVIDLQFCNVKAFFEVPS